MMWTNRHNQVPFTGVGSPGQRAHHALAYDTDRGVTVFFGGEIGVRGSETYFNDTWEYDGTNQWRKIQITGASPSPRSFHAMTYDRVLHYVILYGGQAGGDSFSDTWAYTGDGVNGTWTTLLNVPPFAEVPLPANAGHAMTFDTVGNVPLMLGGWDGIYTGNSQGQCQNLIAASPPYFTYSPATLGYVYYGAPCGCPNRWYGYCSSLVGGLYPYSPFFGQDNGTVLYGLCLAFDESRGTAIALGGYTSAYERGFLGNHFYAYYAGATGTNCYYGCQSTTNNSPWGWNDAGVGPPTRAEAVMAYDARHQRIVMVGGVGPSDVGAETWEYSPTTGWETLPSIPPLPSNGAPSGRAGSAMVYDSRRGVLVLMGGAGAGAEQQVLGDVQRGPGSRFSDTWELVPTRVNISQDPANTWATVCQMTQLSVSATGVGTLHYQWRRDGQQVYDGPQFQDAGTSQLTIPSATYAHEGAYDVVVSDDCATFSTVTSRVAQLTILPGLQWVMRTTNGPPARTQSAMAYDSRRGVTVLFGGYGFSPGYTNQPVALNDLWEWNGSVWVQRMAESPTNGWAKNASGYWILTYQGGQPVNRYGHALAYDSSRGRVVLFGGRASDPAGFDTTFGDTWEWDGARWYFQATNGPAPRFHPPMTYDDSRGVTVLWGGFATSNDFRFVWEWDGHTWKGTTPTNGPSTSYYQVYGAMAYDNFRNYMLSGPITDGFSANSFWDWNGTNWAFLGKGFTTSFPSPTYGGMVSDSYRRREVYFGGDPYGSVQPTNTTAFWNGAAWTLLTSNELLPASRNYPAMAYDSSRHAVVMMGGENIIAGVQQQIANETWELLGLDTPLINVQPASQSHAPGDSVTFYVVAIGPAGATLSYAWYHGPTLLLDGGRIAGAATATLRLANVTAADAGAYTVQVSCSCGTTVSTPAFLAFGTRLQVFVSGANATLIWSNSTATLEQADSVMGPWTQVPGAASPFVVSTAGSAKFFRLQ